MKLKYFSWIPAAILVIAIFTFSSKEAEDSNESSLFITNHIVSLYETLTNINFQGEELINVQERINHIVRKTAHFCEYALLSITFAFHLAVLGMRRMRLFLLPILLSFLNASLDEFHQTFVPGRSGMIADVLLDTAGSTAGSLLFSIGILFFISRKVKSNTLKKSV